MAFDLESKVLFAQGLTFTGHGLSDDALVGRSLKAVAPTVAFDALAASLQAALLGESRVVLYEMQDGARWFSVTTAPIYDDARSITGTVASVVDVSDQKRVERELVESRQLLQDVLDSLEAPISVRDSDARFLLINRAYAQLTGWDCSDIVGQSIYDVFADEFARRFADDDRVVLQQGVTVRDERLVPQKDGQIHPFEISRSPLRRPDGTIYGMASVGIDVTDRKIAEQRLSEITALFETAFAAAPNGMALVGLDGRWLRVNRALCELTGYTESELVASEFTAITHHADRTADRHELHRLLSGSEASASEKRFLTRSGEQIWVLQSCSLIHDSANEPLHVVVHITDISERRTMVEQLRDLAEKDVVTGLANRRRFDQELELCVARCRRYAAGSALLLLDIDDFKLINDRYGHKLGDEALRAVAGVLRHRMRGTDLVARIGGDEFAALLFDVTPDQAKALAESVRAAIADTPAVLGSMSARVTVSVGVAALDRFTTGQDAAFAAADEAMYASKAGGRDRVSMAGRTGP